MPPVGMLGLPQVFDVALWLVWPSLMPDYVALVPASSPFAAVEFVMRLCRVRVVAHAAAASCDGSLVYSAFQVKVIVERGSMFV